MIMTAIRPVERRGMQVLSHTGCDDGVVTNDQVKNGNVE